MKTLAKLAVLLPLAASACGGAASANFHEPQVQSECSMSLRANATSDEVRQAIADVLSGAVDPCGGAHSASGSHAALERIDRQLDAEKQQIVTLVFRVTASHYGTPEP